MTEWILITGSSKGLGKQIALIFAENGYNVIIHGRNEVELEKIKEEIIKKNRECEIVVGDIILNEIIEKLNIIAREKNISILINNAAIGLIKPFEKLTDEEIEKNLKINLFAPIKLTKKIYTLFLEKKSGIIININAMAGLKPSKFHSIYCSTKYGLKGFTDSLRYEAKEHNVRIIGVYLSGMKTEMYASTGADPSNCMEPKEVAETIFNLSKKKNSLLVDEILISRMKY